MLPSSSTPGVGRQDNKVSLTLLFVSFPTTCGIHSSVLAGTSFPEQMDSPTLAQSAEIKQSSNQTHQGLVMFLSLGELKQDQIPYDFCSLLSLYFKRTSKPNGQEQTSKHLGSSFLVIEKQPLIFFLIMEKQRKL